MLKRIGIAGAGNVGAALTLVLASYDDVAEEIVVSSRDDKRAQAAILDAGSAYGESATKFVADDALRGDFDLVAITAGAMPSADMPIEELLALNKQIAVDTLAEVTTKKVVVIGTPVDVLAQEMGEEMPGIQFIGYGGELDKERAIFSMRNRGITDEEVYAIGEHGPRTIPAYASEEQFEEVTEDATTALGNIMKSVKKARNLASGVQLARLVHALAGNESVQCVSIKDPDFDNLSITWPYRLNGDEFEKLEIEVGPKAQAALDNLISKRK